jgi:hypothetical protein
MAAYYYCHQTLYQVYFSQLLLTEVSLFSVQSKICRVQKTIEIQKAVDEIYVEIDKKVLSL